MSANPPITVSVDGEHVQVVGHLATLVESKSTPGEWHATEYSDDEGRWVCTCKGWMVRKTCRHVVAVKRFAANEAVVKMVMDNEGRDV